MPAEKRSKNYLHWRGLCTTLHKASQLFYDLSSSYAATESWSLIPLTRHPSMPGRLMGWLEPTEVDPA